MTPPMPCKICGAPSMIDPTFPDHGGQCVKCRRFVCGKCRKGRKCLHCTKVRDLGKKK